MPKKTKRVGVVDELALQFIANVRLKDIVGRELINDDNVAIIELIKNAKDAGSKRVNIRFGNIPNKNSSDSLLIQDFGRGMSLDDIKFKWLNIAYSEKKVADKKKAYAGNKGIGRFSCDRLGQELVLYTRASRGKLIRVAIDWTKFEIDDQKMEIGTIPFRAEYISAKRLLLETKLKPFAKGTVLHIKTLRSDWSRERLLRLKKELEKFVVDPKNTFSVALKADAHKEINGTIKNAIFEKLEFRTTSLHSRISEDGKTVETWLSHDGERVFRMVEVNPYKDLTNIDISIFNLNQPAKAFFNRQTGYRSTEYGSIFMFLNGFRVLPYGAESDDWLGLDQRKAQGQKRHLGTRELVGFIRVNENSGSFKAVSSREGLVNNAAFKQLTSSKADVSSALESKKIYGYFHKVFRKLEEFVVKGLDWDRISNTKLNDDELLDESNYEYVRDKQKVVDSVNSIVTLRSPKKFVKDLEVDFKYVFELAAQETESHMDFVEQLQEKFEGTSVAKLTPAEKKNLAKFIERQSKKLDAKHETTQQLEHELEVETQRRLFAEVEGTSDVKKLLGMHHESGILALKIYKSFDRCLRRYRRDPDSVSKAQLVNLLEKALFNVDKIQKVSNFATKANFNLKTNRVTTDFVLFTKEYLEKIQQLSSVYGLRVEFDNPKKIELEVSFRPIEAMVLIDNILDNSVKAKAKKVVVSVSKYREKIKISFKDNGRGLPKQFKSSELFERGITTTDGSGIGLSHVKDIVEQMDGSVKLLSNAPKGTKVVLEFEKL